MTFELLTENPAGIGDHSTEDFYRNAEEALQVLVDADDRLKALNKYFTSAAKELINENTSVA